MPHKQDQAVSEFEKFLMRGNQAVGEGAIRAGCRYFFGYPITPQNELFEYMAKRLPEVGGTFLRARANFPVLIWSSGHLPAEGDV